MAGAMNQYRMQPIAIMEPRTNTLVDPRSHIHWPARMLLAAALAFLAGCASKTNTRTLPVPRQDLAEYRQVASDAQKVVHATLVSLDRATAQVPCPPCVIKVFSKDVQDLEVDSFKIRARARAIRARGEAYFEQWHEHLRHVQDPVARQLAEQHHEQLQEQFAKVRGATKQAREAFQPFLAGLHRLNNGLQNDPAIASTPAMQRLIAMTREEGAKVEASLAAVTADLNAAAAMLKPERAAKKE